MPRLSERGLGRKPNPPKVPRGGPRRGDVGRERVSPSAATQYSVYSGTERLGSFRRVGIVFEAYDRLGRSLGVFPTEREAIAAVDPEAGR